MFGVVSADGFEEPTGRSNAEPAALGAPYTRGQQDESWVKERVGRPASTAAVARRRINLVEVVGRCGRWHAETDRADLWPPVVSTPDLHHLLSSPLLSAPPLSSLAARRPSSLMSSSAPIVPREPSSLPGLPEPLQRLRGTDDGDDYPICWSSEGACLWVVLAVGRCML